MTATSESNLARTLVYSEWIAGRGTGVRFPAEARGEDRLRGGPNAYWGCLLVRG
jgi:hypothetical protein